MNHIQSFKNHDQPLHTEKKPNVHTYEWNYLINFFSDSLSSLASL